MAAGWAALVTGTLGALPLYTPYVNGTGLASAFRGRGLGGPLLRLGLEHMVGKGADRVILYVEADNGPAVKVYEDLGFTVAEEHVVWTL